MTISEFITGIIAAVPSVILFRNWRISRKVQKIDYADKVVNFLSKQSDRLMKTAERLEMEVAQLKAEITKLSYLKCDREDCPHRTPPKE